MPESIFTSQTPTSGDNVEPGGIVTGVTFTPAVDGTITGIRLFASTTVGGTYTGQLYLPTSDDDPAGSGTGTLLGTKVFAGTVTSAAWNVITFDTPVPVTGGLTYRATVHNTEGRYVSTGSFPDFTNGVGLTNGNLHAIWNGEPIPALAGDTLTQGVFAGSATPIYPSNTFSAGNYFVDVVFEAVEPAEGVAEFSMALAVAGTGDAPAIAVPTGVAGWGIELTLAANGLTVGAGEGTAAFLMAFAVAGTGDAPVPPDPGGVCGWTIDPSTLGVCDDWLDRPEALRNAAVSMASLYLWAATGRQYGVCPVAIQPRQNMLAPEIYRDYPIWPGQDPVVSGPYLFGGRWFNRGCGSCCNSGGCAIALRGPVVSVIEVIVAGEVVQESAYRVDVSKGAYLLVRTDGQCWPSCGAEPDDFQVTYGLGRELPLALQVATALLACEYAKHLAGGACALPARMTRLSRQGVELEVDTGSAADGTTGIRQVDDVVASLNPGRRQSPPVILSPDLPESCDRMTVWGA